MGIFTKNFLFEEYVIKLKNSNIIAKENNDSNGTVRNYLKLYNLTSKKYER